MAFDIETSNTDFSNVHDEFAKEYFGDDGLGLAYPTRLLLLTLWCPEYPQGIALSHGDILENLDFLKQLFGKREIRYVGHNIVFDLRILVGHYNLPIPPRVWDSYTIEILFADGDPQAKDINPKRFNLASLVTDYEVLKNLPVEILEGQVRPHFELMWGQFNKENRLKVTDNIHLKVKDFSLKQLVKLYKVFKNKRSHLDSDDVVATTSYAILDVIFSYYVFDRQAKRALMEQRTGYHHLLDLIHWETRFTRVCAAMAARGIKINKPLLLTRLAEWNTIQAEACKQMQELSLQYLRQEIRQARQTAKQGVTLTGNTLEELIPQVRRFRFQLREEYAELFKRYKTIKKEFSPSKKDQHTFYLQEVCGLVPVKPAPGMDNFFTPSGAAAYTKDTLPHYVKLYPNVEHYRVWLSFSGHIKKAEEFLAHAGMDGRIHPTIVSRTVTGRTSATGPNTQNADVKEHTKEEDYRFLGVLSSDDDYIAIGSDIANAELYVGAILAKDNKQWAGLREGDFHAYAARFYFRERYDFSLGPKDGINSELRKVAKTVNFGTAYGMGAKKLVYNYPDIRKMLCPPEAEVLALKADPEFQAWGQSEYLRLLPEDLTAVPYRDWEFAATVWKAKQLLMEKDATFRATTEAKYAARDYAEEHGYSLLWSGRRAYIRRYWKKNSEGDYLELDGQRIVQKESKNGWNNLCQGGVGEVSRRWAVLAFEEFEKYPELGAYIINYVHDELVFECPIQYHEVCSRIVVNAFYRVFDTLPLDENGQHWFDRLEPRAYMTADVSHKDNHKKWGWNPYRDYPIAGDFSQKEFDVKTSDFDPEEEKRMLEEFVYAHRN